VKQTLIVIARQSRTVRGGTPKAYGPTMVMSKRIRNDVPAPIRVLRRPDLPRSRGLSVGESQARYDPLIGSRI
jgi:hypothetical protein